MEKQRNLYNKINSVTLCLCVEKSKVIKTQREGKTEKSL